MLTQSFSPKKMKQKIVVKVQVQCDQCRSKAMKIAAAAHGVSEVSIEGADKDQVVVMGDGVDSVCLTRSLRKKLGSATILKVEQLKDDDKDEDEEKEKCSTPIHWTTPYPMQCYGVVVPQYYPETCQPVNCSIM